MILISGSEGYFKKMLDIATAAWLMFLNQNIWRDAQCVMDCELLRKLGFEYYK